MQLHKFLGRRHTYALAISLICGACDGGTGASKQMQPVYDPKTGKLQLLKYDSNGNGKIDTWSHMDGPRVIKIDLDRTRMGSSIDGSTTARTRSSKKSGSPG